MVTRKGRKKMKHYHKKSLHNLLQYMRNLLAGEVAHEEHKCDNPWECDHIHHDIATLEDYMEEETVSDPLTKIRKEGL